MAKSHCCLPILFCGPIAIALGIGTASGQSYPSKPVRIVAPQAGSSGDITTRLIAQAIAASLGQSVIVDNRPARVIPTMVSQSPPDGYTLMYSGSTLWLSPFLLKSAPYDPVRDFQPITQAIRQPALLVVPPTLPVKSVKDLIALAKRAHTGDLNYATASLGSLNHLSAELFNSMAGVKVQRIDYRGGAQMVQDLIAGQVQVLFGTVALVSPFVRSGKLKALGVTSGQPSELAPGVPTLAATGLPGYKKEANDGFFAPAQIPRAILDRINQEIVKALSRSDLKDKLLASGVEPVGSIPEQFEAVIKDEMLTMGKIIKDLGIREE